MTSPRVYLDHSSGTPLLPEAAAAMGEWLQRTGNPSNHLHREGRHAAAALAAARASVAALIGAQPDEMYFTSSGTEANMWALRGLLAAHRTKGTHIIVSAIEHISVLRAVQRLAREGLRVTYLPVDRAGCVRVADVARALQHDTVLVSVMWANHEVGTIQPIAQITEAVRQRGVLLHTDAVAAIGGTEVQVAAVPVDALSLAANQFGGPPGVGALYVRGGLRITPLFDGGIQEHGRRAGTENLLGIIGMGIAADVTRKQRAAWITHRQRLGDQWEQGLSTMGPEARILGREARRLPGHCCFAWEGIDGESLALGMDAHGVALVQSSACTGQTLKASHVLTAMGISETLAQGACLATVGWTTTEEEIEQTLRALRTVVDQLRHVQCA